MKTAREMTLGIMLLAMSAIPSIAFAEDGTPIPEAWKNLSLAQFADLAVREATSPEAMKKKSVPPQLVGFAWDQYLSHDEVLRSADAATLFKLVCPVTTKLSTEQRQQLANRYYQIVFANSRKATPQELVMIGWSLINSGLAQPGKAYPEFTAQVVEYVPSKEHFEEDVAKLQWPEQQASYASRTAITTYLNPFWYVDMRKTIDDKACAFYHALFSDSDVARDYAATYFFSLSMETGEARYALKQKLLAADGGPNLGVAKVMTWAYHRATKTEQTSWAKYLDDQIANASIKGDAHAKWLVARAYCAEGKDDFPGPLAGKQWLDKALSTAASESFRVEVVAALAGRYSLDGHDAEAQSLLKNQMTLVSATAKTRLQALDQQLSISQQASLQYQRDSDHQQELSRLRGQLESLHQRLTQVQTGDNSATQIASLTEAIKVVDARLQAELSKEPAQN